MNATHTMSLTDVIALNLSCLEERLEEKSQVQENILTAIEERFPAVTMGDRPEDYTLAFISRLHEQFGLCLDIDGGKVTGVFIERS